MNRSSTTRQTEKQGLLSTKLIPPRLPSSLVPRRALLARLDAGLDRKVTLISAPPGSGKTTLVAAWLTAQQGVQFGWVSLDAGDNDPVRFWRYTLTAGRAFGGTSGRSALTMLRASQPLAFETILTPFINDLNRLPQRCVLVLEDYHLIVSPAIHAALTFLIDHLPVTMHIVLMTRTEPPLPLARWRARGELNEFTAADLRFSLDEVSAFLAQTGHGPISNEVAARLEQKTEGWAAGLRLIALALQNQSGAHDAEHFLATVSGGLRSVLDYLTGEVLAALPESTQMFLLQTGFLNPLTGAVCDAVTDRSDSATMLDQLERDNLFVIPLGDTAGRRWYRYHALFAEALRHLARQRFGEATIRAWQGKASVWYEAHRFYDEAIEAALNAHDSARVAALIEWSLEARGNHELTTLHRWITQLPDEVLHAHPALCFAAAQAALFTADRYAATTAATVEDRLLAAERGWQAAQNDRGVGQVYALRATAALWRDDLSRSFLYAQRALELLPEDDVDWRGISLLAIGIEQLLAGEVDAAQRTIMDAQVLCRIGQNTYSALAATDMLARTYLAQAQLDQAEQLYQQILTDTGELEALRTDRGLALAGLGLIAYERNDLTAAEAYAAQAANLDSAGGDEEVRVRAALLLARVAQARRQGAAAKDRLRSLAARTQRTLWQREVSAWQAWLALAAEDVTTAQHWLATRAPHTGNVLASQQELEAVIAARLNIAEGQPDAAVTLLEPWRVDAQAHGRTRSELEILSVMALAYAAQSDLAQAKQLLLKALTLAQPAGCVRAFVDEGAAMKTLLQAIAPELTKRALMIFAARVLQAFAPTRSVSATPLSPLLEPLSSQEQRVLKLLAAGLSNPEIARELVVSTNTIKTQVKSIFNKLNVNNRVEAADVARELNLL